MAPPQIAALVSADAAVATEPHALSSVAASLGAEVKSGKNRVLRLLDRALNRLAEAEQAVADCDEQIGHLQSLAMTDSLTGLMNRRGFEDYLRRVTASAERYDEKGVLVYIGLDDFKPINTRSATTWETPCSTSSHVFSLRTSARPIPLPG